MASTATLPLLRIAVFSLLPATALLVGGGAALVWKPGAAARSAILHYAAGVVFSVVAVELLPDIVKEHLPLEVALGFGGGVAAMLGMRAWTETIERRGEQRGEAKTVLPLGLILGITIDLALDGFLLGIGFAAGAKAGTLLALALAGEVLALGLTTSTELRERALPERRIAAVLGGLATTFLAGTALGTWLLRGLSAEWLEMVLSFGLAALLFLVTEELLTEAHEAKETPLLTLAFFGGFLLFLLLGMVI